MSSQSLSLSFILFTGSFAAKRFILIKSNLLIFLWIMLLILCLRNFHQALSHQEFILHFLLTAIWFYTFHLNLLPTLSSFVNLGQGIIPRKHPAAPERWAESPPPSIELMWLPGLNSGGHTCVDDF